MGLGLHLAWFLLVLLDLVVGQSVNVTVDDAFSYSATTRRGIEYFPTEGSWSKSAPANPETRYNETLHITTAVYPRIMLFFQGEEIYYYGDKGPGYGVANVNIDGEVGAYDMANASSSTLQYQQLLWSRTGLGSGDHQILISRNESAGLGQISIDFFRIVSSNNTVVPSLSGPGASVVPDEALIVDNTDQSITYSGGWEPVQSPDGIISNPNSGFYNNTVHRTKIPNEVATFTFNGTAVWYFSDIDMTHGSVQIRVDGGEMEEVNGFRQSILSQRLLWSKTGLSAGQHVVTVRHSGASGQYATLDFFRYLPSNATTSTATGLSQPTQARNTPTKVAIICGIVGGLAGLGALLLGIFLLYRRRKQWASSVPKKFHWDMGPAPEMVGTIEPYEATPFLSGGHEQQPIPMHTHTPAGQLKSPDPGPVTTHSYPTSSSTTESGSYTSMGTSVYGHSQYDSPPSYGQLHARPPREG